MTVEDAHPQLIVRSIDRRERTVTLDDGSVWGLRERSGGMFPYWLLGSGTEELPDGSLQIGGFVADDGGVHEVVPLFADRRYDR
jgi:hypothetical protein